MITTAAYAALEAKAPLEPITIERRDLTDADVLIDIKYAGICHSDIHTARDEWGAATYPVVPGHEIAGVVEAVGPGVTKYKVGDRVGVGVFVDSCRECEHCLIGEERYCLNGPTGTYNSLDKFGNSTKGGYSQRIVVDQHFVFRIPDNLSLDVAAPLLCAGITLYSPLRHWGAASGKRVGIIGLGGLGHVGVKLAHAMGAEVAVLSHSSRKRDDALGLGADHFIETGSGSAFSEHARSFDLLINTVSVQMDVDGLLGLLRRDAALVQVGMPIGPMSVNAGALAQQRRTLAGSDSGGVPETQEMLDFCGVNNIGAEIETIAASDVNKAWDRVVDSDIRYRFVIEASTFDQ
jgi:uncharacterized zinc-type alcohol dehydrogenase-like protein